MSDVSTNEIILRLFVACVLGAAIGLEREFRHKPAGVRTDILVALGTTVMTIVSVQIARFATDAASVNISQIMSQVLPGIGFIGAGVIIHQQGKVEGLTTAASIWLVAGVSMAVGLGLYGLAVAATVMGIGALIVLHAFKVPEGNGDSK